MRAQRTLASLLAVAVAACGATGSFTMSSEDNNPAALKQALDAQRPPAKGKAVNATGKPLAFLVTTGAKKQLVAWDLGAGKALWTVDAEVSSRVVVGQNLVAAREGKDAIVARSVTDGRKLWSHRLGAKATFLGAAVDGDRVFYVIQDDSSSKRSWHLVGLTAGGAEAWRSEAPGTLGAPAAHGGLVFMPFLTQWLSVLDAATGEQKARIKQEDEMISYIRSTPEGVFYGSKGVFFLDEKSATGKRAEATYGTAKLPPDFVRAVYHFDSFNAVQAGYSAFDRNRVLWRADGSSGEIKFVDDQVVVFSYRFFFAFDAVSGELRWAHNHPRNDVVSAEHVGASILYVSLEGELGALDPRTGARITQTNVGARVTGATFDADGFRPAGEGEPPRSAEALSSIVWDKDKRFQSVKLFALAALGRLPGVEVTEALLTILRDEATPPEIYAKAAEVLVARKDAEAVPLLVKALEVRYDYIAGTKPRAVDVIARALGAIGKPEAAPALIAHLEDPETPLQAVKDLVEALGACKNPEALPALRAFLLVYRADPIFASDSGAIAATIDALLALGGGAERELLAYVAEEPRTDEKVADYAKRALAQTAKGK